MQERAPLLEPLSAIRIQVAPAASFLNFLQSTQGNAVPVPRCMVVTSVRNPRTWLPRSALVPFSVLSFPSLYRTRFMRYPFIVFDLHCSLTCKCLCLHLSSRPVNLFSDFYSAACSLSSTRPNSARGPLRATTKTCSRCTANGSSTRRYGPVYPLLFLLPECWIFIMPFLDDGTRLYKVALAIFFSFFIYSCSHGKLILSNTLTVSLFLLYRRTGLHSAAVRRG